MKKFTLIIFLYLFSYCSYSQCNKNNTENSQSPKNSSNDGFVQTVTTLLYTDEYFTIIGILNTDTYQFISTHNDPVIHDYITIRDVSNNVLYYGSSPLTIGGISQSTIQVHIRSSSSCDTDDFAHKLTIQDLTNAPTCYEPDRSSVVASYLSKNRLDFNWSAPSMGTPFDYDWEIVLSGQALGTGFSGSSGGITNATSGEVLTEDTPYDLYIRSDCGGGDTSVWIAKIPFRTLNADPPPNDFCSGAISILQQTGISDASSAVSTAGNLLGGSGTDVMTSPCGGGPRDDVWYKFVAKTTDANITVIPNSNVNFVVSLFSGTCDSLIYLACSGDGFLTDPPDENIYYSSLIIGQTYYIRTYYYTNSTSADRTFNLKIWSTTPATDVDNDGYVASIDCNDNDPNINPETVWYLDSDNDNYAVSTMTQCTSPGVGYTTTVLPLTDCNDAVAAINPGATEVCDGIDNDCDGQVDEDGDTTYYVDSDGDTYGDENDGGTLFCSDPGTGWSLTNDDCNDAVAAINPGATEVPYDGIDNDCNSETLDDDLDEDGFDNANDCDDADDTVNATTMYYVDADGDGYGTTPEGLCSAAAPTGYATVDGDCDDSDDTVYPGATEVCDGVDNDCNGQVDEGVTTTYYADTDGDGYGDVSSTIQACSAPMGYVSDSTDCDDTRVGVNPGEPEIDGNGLDDDCNPSTPDAPLGNELFKLENVKIQPNPFNQSILVHLPLNFENDGFEIYLFDINGRTVIKRKAISLNGLIVIKDLEHFDEGVYFLKVKHIVDGKSVMRQLIKF